MNYTEISKEAFNSLYQTRVNFNSSLNPAIRILAELRVSQINGCAYCCHLHSDEARKLGVSQEKLVLCKLNS